MAVKMGVNFAKGKDASKLLKQALSKGRNSGVRLGLGYKDPEDLKEEIKKQAEKII